MKTAKILNTILLGLVTLVILTGILIKFEQTTFFSYEAKSNRVYAEGITYTAIETASENEIEHEAIVAMIKGMRVDQSKVSKVRKYLSLRNSPLASKSEFIVATAEKFNIDYRLVAAISVIESSAGKYPYRPYNAWGWGGQGGAYTFKNWEEGIYIVSRGLSRYYASGLNTPEEIGRRYNPDTHALWASKVRFVMKQM